MTLYKGADAAYPGNPLPGGTLIVAGYVGAVELLGQPDTPHLWSRQEWNEYLAEDGQFHVPGIRGLPIYTHDYGGNPAIDAQNAVDAVLDLGWTDKAQRLIAWDSEFLIDPAYQTGLDNELWVRGFRLLAYQSPTAASSTPMPRGGRWVFQLQPNQPRFLPAGWAGQQWAFGQAWDADVFSQAVYDGCGRGARVSNP